MAVKSEAGRKPDPEAVKDEASAARLAFAQKLSWHLDNGTRAEGAIRSWSKAAFGEQAGVGDRQVRNWCDGTYLPPDIDTICRLLFGASAEHAAFRTEFRGLWASARPGAGMVRTRAYIDDVDLAVLVPHQVMPANSDEQQVYYSLSFRLDQSGSHGKDSVEIGLKRAFLALLSDEWQPTQSSVFYYKEHKHVRPAGQAGVLEIFDPTDPVGRLNGAPLIDEPFVPIRPKIGAEPQHAPAGGSVTFEVQVGRGDFLVTLADGTASSDAQDAVLDALFASGLPKARKQRLVIKRVTVPIWPDRGEQCP